MSAAPTPIDAHVDARADGAAATRPAGTPSPLLVADGMSVHFPTRHGTIRAVDDVSLTLERGRTLAVVGESGSGKTVLSRAIVGLHRGSGAVLDGRVLLDGIDLAALGRTELRRLWGRRIGLVSQNPMVALNPVVRIGRQITEGLRANLGLSTAAARRRAVELLDAVGIPDAPRRMREYPHQLSGGLRQRVTIAIAISCEPDLLIADEPTTALDVTVQAQILDLLRSLQQERSMAMIFISHDLGVVAGLADEVAVMYAGRVVERAPARELFARPAMPYTTGLLAATPRIGRAGVELRAIEGRPPDMSDLPTGCAFRPRCARATERCAHERPELVAHGAAHHHVACWHPVEAPRPGAAANGGTTDGR